MGSTYVEPDPGFALAQRSVDYLEFDLRQSDADDAEPDTDADGKTFTLRLAFDSDPSTVVLEKTATASAGLVRFDFEALAHRAYARLHYLFTASYLQGSSFGTGNYNPFTRDVPSTNQVNARLGVNIDRWDLSLYSSNLLNSRDKVGNAGNGRGGCNAATGGVGCTVYSLFNPFVSQQYQKPRTIGLQANYKF